MIKINKEILLSICLIVVVIGVLFAGIITATANEGVIASEDELLGKYATSDKLFKRVEIGNMIVYRHQRMIDNAIVEKDRIVYIFDKNTKGLIEKVAQWQRDLPEHVTPAITKEDAESIAGGGSATLYFISPDSDVFPIKPTPENPCWIVTKADNVNITITIIDAINGTTLGYGIPPPHTGFSFSGPNQQILLWWTHWDRWYKNAESWFDNMGYSTESCVDPDEEKIKSHIQCTETAMFYEIAHGGSSSFKNTPTDSIHGFEIRNWIKCYTKMPFTFLASCNGMCDTSSHTLSYEFRKGSTEATVTVGYCGMSVEPCRSECWPLSVDWQDTLFNHMNQGDTVRDAFDKACARYDECIPCMRFAGDDDFAVVPTVKRGEFGIDIITPTKSSPASAGTCTNPCHIDVTTEVKEGTTPVTGLTNADFSFKIGGKAAAASLTDTSIPGSYVFNVKLPQQDDSGKYDLEVTLNYKDCTFTDTEEDAVIYTAGGDVMLIIDRSGSMSGSAIADARNSAKLFVDYMRDGDEAGVASFASSAGINYHLTP